MLSDLICTSMYSTLRLSPRNSLFPYTTLFRSRRRWRVHHAHGRARNRGQVPPPDQGHRHQEQHPRHDQVGDRKSTRLNSSHLVISYAVLCLKKNIITIIPLYNNYYMNLMTILI